MREMRVSPAAISANVAALVDQAAAPHAMVVVKANGYGHGAVLSARAALEGGANWLGTADIDEALELRQAGIEAPVLAWLVGPGSAVGEAIEREIDLGISSLSQLEQVAEAASGAARARLHVKVDTGMGRGGVTPADWPALFTRLAHWQNTGRVRAVGAFTHMSLKNPESDERQGHVFDDALTMLDEHGISPEIRHAASSIPASRSHSLRYDMVRLGIATYGVPLTDEHRALSLTPAMRVAGQVILVKRLPASHGVGYDLTYETTRETTMVVVPLGYADGIPRHASSRGPVSIGGHRFTVSGRVSMDQVSVDVADSDVQVGQWAVFWGNPEEGEPHVLEWAEAAGTNAYEILTRVGNRVARVIR